MNNTLSYIVACPHCGITKRVAFASTPYYNHLYRIWSDGRLDIPGWREPAWTQQCPSCERFFILPPKSTLQVDNTPCDDTGELPFSTLKQAVAELSGDEPAEMRARLDAWWAYNELYKDVPDEDIPSEDSEYNWVNMQYLLNYYLKQETRPYTLIFELMRLLNQTDEYQRLLDSITFEVFVAWRQSRHQRSDVTTVYNEEVDRRLYMRFVEEKKRALGKAGSVFCV